MARFANSPWRTVLIIVLVVALLMGAIFGLRSIFSEEDKDAKKTISVSYSIGELSDAGKYVEAETAIYTKEAFECQGVRITPDFDNTVTYEVYFYDEDGYFISKSKEMDNIFTGEPLLAKYARIKITPVDDESVSWWEIAKYAGQLKVEVNVKQNDFKNVAKFSAAVDSGAWHVSDYFDLSSTSFLILKSTVPNNTLYLSIYSEGKIQCGVQFIVLDQTVTSEFSDSSSQCVYESVVCGDNVYIIASISSSIDSGKVQVKTTGFGFTSVYLI